MGHEKSAPRGGSAQKLVSCALSATLCIGMIPQAAFAQVGDVASGSPDISLFASGEEVSVGVLKYRLDASAKTACVIDYAISFSQRPDDIIIPETIEHNGVKYTVTAIGDEDDTSAGQICGKKSLTVPATVTYLYGIPFADSGTYYFLGVAPDMDATTAFLLWGGGDSLDGEIYCLAENLSKTLSWNAFSFSEWADSYQYVYSVDTFAAPTGVSLSDADGVDKTGSTVSLPAGRAYVLTAKNLPVNKASDFLAIHTAITWSTSDASVASVDSGAVTVASDAAASSTAVITATNALGKSASVTVSVEAAAAKDIATLDVSPASIGELFLGQLAEPSVTVKDGTYVLTQGVEYAVSYETAAEEPVASFSDIDAAGDYNLIVTGQGESYTGSVKIPFSVVDELTCGEWKYKPTDASHASITGYTGSSTVDNLVVPAEIMGFEVATLEAGVLDGVSASGVVVIPDTVSSLAAGAFANVSASTFKFLGGVSGFSAVALPQGAKVQYFADYGVREFYRVFGSGCSYEQISVPWVYRVELSGGKDAPVRAGVIESSGDLPAYRGESGAKTQVAVPAEIDGVAITELGAFALYGVSSPFEFALVDVPASVGKLGFNALDGASGLIRFEGACPTAENPGNVKGAKIWYPDVREESWSACTWAVPAGSFDSNWTMRYDAETGSWSVAGYVGDATALSLPESYCGWKNVTGVRMNAFPDASVFESITIPDTITSVARIAFKNVTCDITFTGKPPAGVDYKTEFQNAYGKTMGKTLRYPVAYASEWAASEWVSAGNYKTAQYGVCIPENFKYASTDVPGEYLVTGYSGAETSLQIPAQVEGIIAELDGVSGSAVSGTVVGIADYAFENRMALKDIIVPETVRSIGQAAFYNCRTLRYVGIEGNGLKAIDEQAFWYCYKLASISLPRTIESIGSGAFISETLERIDIGVGGSVYKSIDGVVFSADGTHLVCYPMGRKDAVYTVPVTVTHIDEQAFRGSHTDMGNALTEVVLPDGLTSIGWAAFRYAKSLERVSIPDSVTDLGTYAFDCCGKLSQAKLPATLEAVPDGLFMACYELAEIELPSTVKTIGEWAFDRCPLTKISLPEGLTYIGPKAFERSKFAEVSLPSTLKEIGDHAFYLNEDLTSIDFGGNGSLETLGIGVFAGCSSLPSVVIPNTLTSMGRAVFGSCYDLTDIRFEEGCQLTTLPGGAFENDYNLQNITLPASITLVDDMAFYNCLGLEKGSVVFLNQGEWVLGDRVFTYGTSYEPYYTDAYGYSTSSTPDFFTADRFHSIDIVFAADLPETFTATAYDPFELGVKAFTENGDISYEWLLNEEAVEDAEGETCTFSLDDEGTYAVRVNVRNSYDPTHPATQVCRVNVGAPAEADVVRLAGNSADETAARIAQETFPEGSEWVVIARDDDFRDAMSATGLAGALDAPIILTGRDGLSVAAQDAILSLGASKAYVIGGTGALPGDFEGDLLDLGIDMGDELRVFGTSAEETSVVCAQKILEHGGQGASLDKAIVTMQDDFADALSMSSFAYRYGVPILLLTPGSSRVLTQEAIDLLSGDGALANATVYVPGGTVAVPEDVLTCLGRENGKSLIRLTEGSDAYDTSNYIANYMVENGYLSARTTTVAAGYQLCKGVDALAGAALAGKQGGVLILANGTKNDDGPNLTTIEGFLTEKSAQVRKAYVLGGTTVMPEAMVEEDIKGALAR